MTLRVNEIQRVLKPTGSFYLHCDPTASHYLKLVLDSVFIPRGGDYRNEIIWKRTSAHNSARRFGPIHDVILFYTKSTGDKFTWNPQFTTYSEKYIKDFYKHKDENDRLYRLSDLTGSGTRNGETGQNWRGVDVTARGRHWMVPPSELDELDKAGRIYWPPKGTMPSYKRFLDEMKGVMLQDVFDDIPLIGASSAERLGYPTQKPEALLERIILASSNEGDVVMDAYCGCGTTVAVAQRLNRQWIGLDITYQSIALILRRLEAAFGAAVADAVVLDGVPKDMAAAQALALKKEDRTRKEFEKWALLTYSNNRAIVNEKKGADGGVDGIAYTRTGGDSNAKVVFQVKSGNVKSGDIDALVGVMSKVGAELAVFITLKDATAPMKGAAASAGTWLHPQMGKRYPRVRIVSIREMFDDKARLDLPMSIEVLKTAAAAKTSVVQPALDMSHDAPDEAPGDETQDDA